MDEIDAFISKIPIFRERLSLIVEGSIIIESFWSADIHDHPDFVPFVICCLVAAVICNPASVLFLGGGTKAGLHTTAAATSLMADGKGYKASQAEDQPISNEKLQVLRLVLCRL